MLIYGEHWPDETPLATIHLWCYRNWTSANKDMLPRHEHFIEAIKNLWPEKLDNGEQGYIWSPWSYRRAKEFVNNEYQIWWGPAASGKSTDAGIFVLTHWLADPQNTTCVACSTSKDMLERRIWREITRFHSMLAGRIPGERFKTPPRIVYLDPNDPSGENTIAGIFGVPVTQGTVEDAISRLSGLHNKNNLLVVDEMQATLLAAVEAYDNISATQGENKFLGMGNPMRRTDPMGLKSIPKSGNWKDITPALEKWQTKRGVVVYFDGLKSPGVEDPKRYPFYLGQKHIENMTMDPGPDSPRFWSQVRGFMPGEGLRDTVLTESFIEKFNMRNKAVWRYGYTTIYGLDPAMTATGNACVLKPLRIGLLVNGTMAIAEQESIRIPLELSSGEPMSFFLAKRVLKEIEKTGTPVSHLGVDITGQQSAIADIVDSLSGQRCHRVHSAASASEMPVSKQDRRRCCDAYKNKITEIWIRARLFGMYGQIREMREKTIRDMTTREILEATDAQGRVIIQPKEDLKEALQGYSPDDGDAFAIGLDVAFNVKGMIPGVGLNISGEEHSKKMQFARRERETNPYSERPPEETQFIFS